MTAASFYKFHYRRIALMVSWGLTILAVPLPAGADTPSSPLPQSPRITPVAEASDPSANATREGSEVALLRGEIAALRADLKQLQESLNIILNQITADLRRDNDVLRQENQLLREEVQRLGGTPPNMAPATGSPENTAAENRLPAAFPAPTPQDDALPPDSVDAHSAESDGVPPPSQETDDTVPAEPPAWETVASWGREPEDAKALGPDILSQKGIVGVTAPGAGRGALIALGRALRREYDNYDIINVDIFDDRTEAENYAQNRHPDPRHRVLSIMRHLRTGQDVILLYRDGLAESVPPSP